MRTSPSYTASYRLKVDESTSSVADVIDAVAETGAEVKGLDVAYSDRGHITIDLTCDMRDSEHRREVEHTLDSLPGVTTSSVADQTFLSHIGGKIEIHSKVPLRNRDDLSRAYTPGVARVCTAIHDSPQKAHLLTMKANTVAVVSDGTAVLGL
ncbi:MAG: NAD-dependent malic enzyme, partial [Pauljensenia sp.]